MTTAAVLKIRLMAEGIKATNAQLATVQGNLSKTAAAGNRMGGVLSKVGRVGAAGLAYGLYKGARAGAAFEKQIDSLGAVTDATGRQMRRLERQALRLGAKTAFSAGEAAQAQTELAKGGVAVRDILKGGLPAALSLAAAGELELADAAATTVNAMKLFGLQGRQASRVADIMATAANRTTADVSDFALALRQGGSAAKQAGLGLNQTMIVLEALAEAGIKGSDAGTSMKTSLIQLLAPSAKQAELARRLGLEWTNQAGNIKSVTQLSAMLRAETANMTRAERTKTFAILAGTDGFRTLAALYDAGPAKLRRLSKANLEQGTAQQVARRKMDNTAGAIERLQGSLETLAVKVFRQVNPALRKLVDTATGVVDDIGRVLDSPNLSAGEKLARLINMGVPAAAKAGANLAGAVGRGFVSAWYDMGFVAKVFTAAALIRVVGGRGALLGAGGVIGRLLGVGIASGAATTAAGAGGAGVAAGGAGGLLASLRSKLLPFAKRAGLAGVGIALADSVVSEFGRRAAARSGDVRAALEAAAKPTTVAGLNRNNFALFKAIGDLSGEGERIRQAERLKDALFDIRNAEKGIGHQKAEQLRMEIAKLPEASDAAKRAMNRIVDGFQRTGQQSRAVQSAIERMSKGSSGSIGSLRTNVRLNTRLIRTALGEDTAAGRKALTDNFQAAVRNVRRSMREGTISTRQGTREIERLMIAALQNMGFSKEQALKVRSRKGKGGNLALGPGSGAELRPNQRGGPITIGALSGDSVPSMLERGEYVLNRNAVQKVGRRKLDQINFGHAPRFQGGGIVPVPGSPGEYANRSILDEIGWVKSHWPGLVLTDAYGQGHQSPGHTVTGTAADFSGPDALMDAAVRALVARGYLVGYDGRFGSQDWPGHGPSSRTSNFHFHVEFGTDGRTITGGAAGMLATIPQVLIDGPDSPLKSLAQGAVDNVRTGAQQQLEAAAAAALGSPVAGGLGGVIGANFSGPWTQVMAKIARSRGWSLPDWKTLVSKESGGDPTAVNPTSGAFGLGQFLGPTLEAYARYGAKSRNPVDQIRAMAQYIADRYGTPSAALQFHLAHNWYREGGLVGMVGDSLGVGTAAAGLSGMLGGRLRANNQVGRSSAAGVQALKGMLGRRFHQFIFDLGTNDGTAGATVAALRAADRMTGNRPLLAMTVNGPAAKDKNAALRALAGDEIKVLEWATRSKGLVGPDGIHPTGAGYKQRAHMVAGAVKSMVKSKKRAARKVKSRRKGKPHTGGPVPTIGDLDKTLHILRTSDKQGARSEALHGLLDKVGAVGLPSKLAGRITFFQSAADMASDLAARAGELTFEPTGPDGDPLLDADRRPLTEWGLVGGKTQIDWLNDQLAALFNLRDSILAAQEIVANKREAIGRLVEAAQKRLDRMADEIRFAAQVRRQVAADLEKAQKHPKRNAGRIKDLKRVLRSIDSDQAGRVRVRDNLKDRILPALTGKRSKLGTRLEELAGPSGLLADVQGFVSGDVPRGARPPVGVLGGQIFDVQMQLRELGAPKTPVPLDTSSPVDEGDDESAALLRELLRQANLRTAVSEAQFKVLRDTASVPYLGAFAKGGVALVGENGPELAHMPSGTRVHTATDTQAMLQPGDVRVVVNGNIIQEAGDRRDPVEVLIGDRRFDAAVEQATRRIARQGARGLPSRGGGQAR